MTSNQITGIACLVMFVLFMIWPRIGKFSKDQNLEDVVFGVAGGLLLGVGLGLLVF